MESHALNTATSPLDLLKRVRSLTSNNLRNAPSITIIGSGVAGLTCAYELKRLGANITLLEADQGHIGGRVRTLRESDRLYSELGAMRIPTLHHFTRHYIEEKRV